MHPIHQLKETSQNVKAKEQKLLLTDHSKNFFLSSSTIFPAIWSYPQKESGNKLGFFLFIYKYSYHFVLPPRDTLFLSNRKIFFFLRKTIVRL